MVGKMRAGIVLIILMTGFVFAGQNNWRIVINKELAQDAAVQLAMQDLQSACEDVGIELSTSYKMKLADHTLLVGSPERNDLVAKLIEKQELELESISDEQGYEIKTLFLDGKTVVVTAGASIPAEVYALYRIWDQLKIQKSMPELNELRIPDLKIRFTRGASKEDMHIALRYGATWVCGSYSSNHLVPWDAEPERTENEKNRLKVKALAEYAHSLHLKYFVYEDEFSYHPTLLDEFGATLNPEDPVFWDAVQAKYRRLLQALPEIDGIRLRTGEATRVGGNFRAFDVMHDKTLSDWSLEKRYRTFVKKIYNVVVGEFGKIYYQRTWVTSAHEQHSMAEVYKGIFTDDVPVRDLYLSPYLSTTDRYFHQPYNPTFNQTPHNMIVLLSPLDYHGHNNAFIFPTYPAAYYQNGLRTIFSGETSNCVGTDFGLQPQMKWNTWSLTAYTVYRLSWNMNQDIRQIAQDFSKLYASTEYADHLADLLLMSPNAYKYGLYIEPVSHWQFNSLLQLRLTTFPAKGLPKLDGGRKHMEFLEKIYYRCNPWQTETLLYLDYGLDLGKKMKIIASQLPDTLDDIKNSVDLTYGLIECNNLYVKTLFAYFNYRDQQEEKNRLALELSAMQLKTAIHSFKNTPNCIYRLDGPEQLLVNAKEMLKDPQAAIAVLKHAPNDTEIDEIIDDQQAKYAAILEENQADAVKLLYWQGRVDGRDLLHIRLDSLIVEHLRYDQIQEMKSDFFDKLPLEEYTVIPVDIQSRSFHPFILEQPSKDNDYTVTLYLSDFPEHGYSWWKFELYYISKTPDALGLVPPWDPKNRR